MTTTHDPRKAPGYSEVEGVTLMAVQRSGLHQIKIDTWGGEGFQIGADGKRQDCTLMSGTINLTFAFEAVAADAEAILRRWAEDNTALQVTQNAVGDVSMQSLETGEKVGAGPSYG